MTALGTGEVVYVGIYKSAEMAALAVARAKAAAEAAEASEAAEEEEDDSSVPPTPPAAPAPAASPAAAPIPALAPTASPVDSGLKLILGQVDTVIAEEETKKKVHVQTIMSIHFTETLLHIFCTFLLVRSTVTGELRGEVGGQALSRDGYQPKCFGCADTRGSGGRVCFFAGPTVCDKQCHLHARAHQAGSDGLSLHSVYRLKRGVFKEELARFAQSCRTMKTELESYKRQRL